MDLKLAGKVGIITGASRGIGAGIAHALAREGCKLTLAARSTDELERCAGEVRKAGGQALVSTADIRQPASAAALVEATLAAFGRLDFLVTNAGTAKMGHFLSLTDEDWQEGYALKFFGHMRLIRAAWPHLKAAKGSVVVIAGAAGREPAATSMITGSVNAGLMNFTKGLASLGIDDGVQVNAVLPGAVRTERFFGRMSAAAKSLGVSEAEAERRMVAEKHITRIGEPEDIAGLIAFILSPQGSYLQGALIDMDGGRTKGI